jgi:hypothetical protein
LLMTHAVLGVRHLCDLGVGAAAAAWHVAAVERIVAIVGQHAGEPRWDLRVDEDFTQRRAARCDACSRPG